MHRCQAIEGEGERCTDVRRVPLRKRDVCLHFLASQRLLTVAFAAVFQLDQKCEQQRTLQRSLDEKRAELVSAEVQLRQSEEKSRCSAATLQSELGHDLRVSLGGTTCAGVAGSPPPHGARRHHIRLRHTSYV